MMPVIKEMMKKRNYKLRDLIQNDSHSCFIFGETGNTRNIEKCEYIGRDEELLHDSDRGSNR